MVVDGTGFRLSMGNGSQGTLQSNCPAGILGLRFEAFDIDLDHLTGSETRWMVRLKLRCYCYARDMEEKLCTVFLV